MLNYWICYECVHHVSQTIVQFDHYRLRDVTTRARLIATNHPTGRPAPPWTVPPDTQPQTPNPTHPTPHGNHPTPLFLGKEVALWGGVFTLNLPVCYKRHETQCDFANKKTENTVLLYF